MLLLIQTRRNLLLNPQGSIKAATKGISYVQFERNSIHNCKNNNSHSNSNNTKT